MSDTYSSAALRGFGDTYTDAALRGGGKLRKGSPEARAHMAYVRSLRAGKKAKGGFGIGTALTLIPAAIKGAHLLYKGVKWLLNRNKGSGRIGSKGGRALILDPIARDDYIQSIKDKFSGRRLAAYWPYDLPKARAHAEMRKKRMSARVRKYLEDNGLMDNALFDTASMRKYTKQASAALKNAYIESAKEKARAKIREREARKAASEARKAARANKRSNATYDSQAANALGFDDIPDRDVSPGY